ncbi:hypothetical protein B0H16DRAFT_135734 [Mycena metata]|uniref:Uncharacterized protein n=1 Tax=Mycena metata TaxID=1033252 RepID=A0AAD7I4Q4_9AGAR|nr:hypothetical protein B0H16DRAFT_135734 [Mycena metata]
MPWERCVSPIFPCPQSHFLSCFLPPAGSGRSNPLAPPAPLASRSLSRPFSLSTIPPTSLFHPSPHPLCLNLAPSITAYPPPPSLPIPRPRPGVPPSQRAFFAICRCLLIGRNLLLPLKPFPRPETPRIATLSLFTAITCTARRLPPPLPMRCSGTQITSFRLGMCLSFSSSHLLPRYTPRLPKFPRCSRSLNSGRKYSLPIENHVPVLSQYFSQVLYSV